MRFDYGLRCLAAAAGAWLGIRLFGRLSSPRDPTSALEFLSTAFTLCCLVIVFCISVLARRKRLSPPPRLWAVWVALAWASLQLLTIIFLGLRPFFS